MLLKECFTKARKLHYLSKVGGQILVELYIL